MQSLRIVTTSEDFDAYARHVVLGDPKTRRLFIILGTVMTLCTAPVPVFLIVAFSGNYMAAFVAGAMVTTLMLIAAWDIARRSGERRLLRSAAQGPFGTPGEWLLSVDDSGLRAQRHGVDVLVPWDAVADIGDSGGPLFIRTADAHVLIIPNAGVDPVAASFVQALRDGFAVHGSPQRPVEQAHQPGSRSLD